eukprot:scaffold113895_cov32-Tisochrysis_lutea.AAC.2
MNYSSRKASPHSERRWVPRHIRGGAPRLGMLLGGAQKGHHPSEAFCMRTTGLKRVKTAQVVEILAQAQASLALHVRAGIPEASLPWLGTRGLAPVVKQVVLGTASAC